MSLKESLGKEVSSATASRTTASLVSGVGKGTYNLTRMELIGERWMGSKRCDDEPFPPPLHCKRHRLA